MMKSLRMFALICATVITVCPLTVSAAVFPQAEESENLFEGGDDPEGCVISYVRGSGTLPSDFVIPSVFEGEPVYAIGENGFASLTELVHVTVPGSVVLIGKGGFGSCSNLQKIDLSSGLIGIDDNAFDYCSSLTEFVMPDTVTNLGSSVFFRCSSLKSVTFSQNLAVMGQGTFMRCDALTEVSLPASLKKVGAMAFRSCANLKTATVAGSVCSEQMFAECPLLESVTFLDPQCEICGYGSTVCNEIKDVVKGNYSGVIRGYRGSTAQEYAEKWNYRFEPLDPETPPEIDYSRQPVQFDVEHKYTEKGVCYEYMGDYIAVRGFVSGQVPETLVLPQDIAGISVTEIGENAFAGMTGVQFVTVPMSIEEIGSGAFTQCPDLKEIRIYNPDAEISSKGTVFSNDDNGNFSGVLCGYVPSDLKGYTAFREMIFLELEQVRGDAMLDGAIDVVDAQLALRYYTETVSGKTPDMNRIQKKTADVNGNQKIDIEDAMLILKYYTECSVAGKSISWDDLLGG